MHGVNYFSGTPHLCAFTTGIREFTVHDYWRFVARSVPVLLQVGTAAGRSEEAKAEAEAGIESAAK